MSILDGIHVCFKAVQPIIRPNNINIISELDILPFLVDQWSRKIFNLFKKVRKIIGENNLFYLSHDRKVI